MIPIKFIIVSPRRHTLVLGTSGQLWAFGNGAKGQTGTGKSEDSLTPTLVQLPSTTDSAPAIPKGLSVWAELVLSRFQ